MAPDIPNVIHGAMKYFLSAFYLTISMHLLNISALSMITTFNFLLARVTFWKSIFIVW